MIISMSLWGPHPLPIFLHKLHVQTSINQLAQLRDWLFGFFFTMKAACTVQVCIFEICIAKKNTRMDNLVTLQAVRTSCLCKNIGSWWEPWGNSLGCCSNDLQIPRGPCYPELWFSSEMNYPFAARQKAFSSSHLGCSSMWAARKTA